MDTSEQTIPGFGQFLRNQRLARNMDLTTVSQKTKIRAVVLEQIESEDFDNLPEPVFTRGFIKSFAEAVGADDEEAIRRYEAGRVQHAGPNQSEAAPVPSLERSKSRWVLLLFLVIVLAAAAFFVIRQGADTPTQPNRDDAAVVPTEVTSPDEPSHSKIMVPPADDDDSTEAAETETKNQAFEATEDDSPTTMTTGNDSLAERELNQPAAESTTEPSADDLIQPVPSDTVDESKGISQQKETLGDTRDGAQDQIVLRKKVLIVKAVETCWMKITIDNNDPIEATLQPGDKAVYRADSTFKLRLGNIGGVQLTLDGEPVLVPGDSGKVRTFSLP